MVYAKMKEQIKANPNLYYQTDELEEERENEQGRSK